MFVNDVNKSRRFMSRLSEPVEALDLRICKANESISLFDHKNVLTSSSTSASTNETNGHHNTLKEIEAAKYNESQHNLQLIIADRNRQKITPYSRNKSRDLSRSATPVSKAEYHHSPNRLLQHGLPIDPFIPNHEARERLMVSLPSSPSSNIFAQNQGYKTKALDAPQYLSKHLISSDSALTCMTSPSAFQTFLHEEPFSRETKILSDNASVQNRTQQHYSQIKQENEKNYVLSNFNIMKEEPLSPEQTDSISPRHLEEHATDLYSTTFHNNYYSNTNTTLINRRPFSRLNESSTTYDNTFDKRLIVLSKPSFMVQQNDPKSAFMVQSCNRNELLLSSKEDFTVASSTTALGLDQRLKMIESSHTNSASNAWEDEFVPHSPTMLQQPPQSPHSNIIMEEAKAAVAAASNNQTRVTYLLQRNRNENPIDYSYSPRAPTPTLQNDFDVLLPHPPLLQHGDYSLNNHESPDDPSSLFMQQNNYLMYQQQKSRAVNMANINMEGNISPIFSIENNAMSSGSSRSRISANNLQSKGKRGRPRKHAPKIPLPPLYIFIRNMLHNRSYNPRIVSWVNELIGIFKVNDTGEFAKTWGMMKSNRNEEMNYEKMSRAMRYHYGNAKQGRKGHLAMVKEKRLVYRFGELAINWRSSEIHKRNCEYHDLCKGCLCLWTKE